MKSIQITDNFAEMAKIGKELFIEKQNKYNDTLISMMKDHIRKMNPQSTDEEIDDLFYVTVYHYWVYGSTFDEFFYYDFGSKTHEEKLEYMTFRVRLLYMEHLNKKEDAHILFNKYETYTLFKDYYKRDVILCANEEDFPKFCEFTEKHSEFVVKPTDMSGGRGIYKTSVKGFDSNRLKDFFSNLLNEGKQNNEKYLRGKEGSIVIEELIDQADELAVFNPESVNGVRVPTVVVDGKVHIYEPWLKIGRGGQFLTSAVFGTMDAGINAETGIVDTPGVTETGEVWEFHPDNHIRIPGFVIPRWNELVEMATECALKLPTMRYVGWDFVLSKKGWCMMEGNYSGDFMWQLYRSKGMKKDFEKLIGWKLDKQFWWE